VPPTIRNAPQKKCNGFYRCSDHILKKPWYSPITLSHLVKMAAKQKVLGDQAQLIADIALETVRLLPPRGLPQDCEWTVVAAIVCEDTSIATNNLNTIAIATGVKLFKILSLLNKTMLKRIPPKLFLFLFFHSRINVLVGIALKPLKKMVILTEFSKIHMLKCYVVALW
jgi:hypothetical protein